MEKLPISEIEKKIKEALNSKEAEIQEILADYGLDTESEIDVTDAIKALDCEEGSVASISDFVPDLEFVAEYNRDDYGAEAYVAFKYKPTDQLIGVEGWYSSEEGFESSTGFVEMEPYTVTHYRKAK